MVQEMSKNGLKDFGVDCIKRHRATTSLGRKSLGQNVYGPTCGLSIRTSGDHTGEKGPPKTLKPDLRKFKSGLRPGGRRAAAPFGSQMRNYEIITGPGTPLVNKSKEANTIQNTKTQTIRPPAAYLLFWSVQSPPWTYAFRGTIVKIYSVAPPRVQWIVGGASDP